MKQLKSKILAGLAITFIGPVAALLVVWVPPFNITSIGSPVVPTEGQIDQLRQVPSDELLTEQRLMASGAPTFYELRAAEVLQAAGELLDGKQFFVSNGISRPATVPFEANANILGTTTWSLRLCSLAVPGLLARAHTISGDARYLNAAVAYINDWSRFEATLWLPRGFVYNDHAMAARAVVVTEVWRLYRQSELYEPGIARKLLRYARKLMDLLDDERLYEYRSNHGIMQSLSLLHLATAFPALPDAEKFARVSVDRLLSQLKYFVSGEGVILENSPGYHHSYIGGLSAIWRYMGLREIPVPEELVRRYEKAIVFGSRMIRPDDTLPPIGDTTDGPLNPVPIATFDNQRMVSRPLKKTSLGDRPPASLTMAPISGYAIVWQGLEYWPDAGRLSQTVLHWSDFPTRVHKHADELGLSIWVDGTQWVRAIGYWPWNSARTAAIGWRSSNAPHWLGESQSTQRSVSLLSFGIQKEVAAFDAVRRNSNGSWIRRQLIQPADLVWTIVDSFHDNAQNSGEIIWRFGPGVQLQRLGQDHFRIEKPGESRVLEVSFAGIGKRSVEADSSGTADWNSGVVHGTTVTPSPAIRVLVYEKDSVVASAFELRKPERASNALPLFEVTWQGEDTWSIGKTVDGQPRFAVDRTADRLSVTDPTGALHKLKLSAPKADSAAKSMEESIATYQEAARRYGSPFRLKLLRRQKVTALIIAGVILQVGVLLFIFTRLPRWKSLAVGTMTLGWLAFALFLHQIFLA